MKNACTHTHTHTVHKMQHSAMIQQLIHVGTAVLLRANQFVMHWNCAKLWGNKNGSYVSFRKFVITCLWLQTKHYLYVIYVVARCDIMCFLFCSLRVEDSTLLPTGCLPTIRGHTSTTYWVKGISKLVLQISQRRLECFLFKDQRGVCVCVGGGMCMHVCMCACMLTTQLLLDLALLIQITHNVALGLQSCGIWHHIILEQG
jgi:hypothetical protein